MHPPSRHSLAQILALNRTVAIVLLSVLLFGLGEHLWSGYMPAYLRVEAKGYAQEAGTAAALSWKVLWLVGLYTCLRNMFEGFCYWFGGQLTARLGDRGSLILFALMTLTGYVLFLTVAAEWAGVAAALLILGWEPLSVPATFTTVGSTVTTQSQGMAFALQSIQKRLPKVLGPPLGGLVLDAARGTWGDDQGHVYGMRCLVGIALALGLVSLLVQVRYLPHHPPSPPGPPAGHILRDLHPTLRRLLLAEIFTRWCDWLVRDFILLYLFLVHRLPFTVIGGLFALQNFTALLTYLPIGRMTTAYGLQPFIGITFIFFALFPLTLALAPNLPWLYGAFIVYGLREIGEPARKTLITTLMPPAYRARGVGLYWSLRSFGTCWASLVGALLWFSWGPDILLYAASAVGCLGAGLYYRFCRVSNPNHTQRGS